MADLERIYQTEWESYRDKKSVGCMLGAVPLVMVILLANFGEKFFGTWTVPIIFVLFAGMLLLSGATYKWSRFRCPRCKKYFHSRAKGLRRDTERCQKCRLPIYFGSEWFYDRWGTEKGKQLIQEYKTHPREYLE